MVRKVLQVFYKEVRSLHQAAYVLAVFTFGSQLLALVRDRLLAHQFGAGIELDIYYTAFRIPDVMYVVFASTLSVYVLIPFVTDRMDGKRNLAARDLLSQVFTVFLITYSFLALVLWVMAPYVVPVAFPGLAEQSDHVVLLLRILLLQPLLLGVSSLLGVVTQMGHRFILYAVSPLLYNLGIIFGIAYLYDWFGLAGLGYGVIIGAFLHMFVQWPLMRQSDLAFGLRRYIQWSAIMQVLRVSIPRAATLTLHQVTLLVAITITSMLAVGSIAVFQFAYNLQSVPLAVIGASYSTAAFPFLADLYSQKRFIEFRRYVVTAFRHIIFWAIPAVVLIIVLRAQIVRVVLGSGEFSWSDTRLTAAVLALLSVSLVAQSINLLLVRAFYAAGLTKIPFLVTAAGTALAAILMGLLALSSFYMTNWYQHLTTWLRVDDVSDSQVILVALGFSIAMILQITVLLFYTAHTFSISFRWLPVHLSRAITASISGGVASYIMLQVLALIVDQNTFLGIFIQGLLAAVVGIMVVAATYYIVRTPESVEVYKAIKKRFGTSKVVASTDDVL